MARRGTWSRCTKSKLLTFPGGRFNSTDENERARFAVYALNRRAAEAATVRVAATGILDGQGQDRPLVVLGDLNDTEQAGTTQLLYGPPGSRYGTGGFNHPPTAAMRSGCGTWLRRSASSTATPASSKANAN